MVALIVITMWVSSIGFVIILAGSLFLRFILWLEYGGWTSWTLLTWTRLPKPTGWHGLDSIIRDVFLMDIALVSLAMAVGCYLVYWIFWALAYDHERYQ